MALDVALIGSIISGIGGLFGKRKKSSSVATVDSTTGGTQQDLSGNLIRSLEGQLSQLMRSGAVPGAQQAQQSQLDRLTQFDPESFAEQIGEQATAATRSAVESGTNAILSQAGGGRGSSSAALANARIRDDAASNLGGILAQARGTGEQIRTAGITSASSDINQQLSNLLAIARGARVTGNLREQGTQSGTGNTRAGGGVGGFFSGLSSGLNTFFGLKQ